MAMESAMTGHLVFSTIHTNSAAETITRVFNLGAKPYMLSGTFNLVLAERLCRKVCSQCKTSKSIIDDPKFKYAKESFKNFNQDLLKKEIIARNINQEQWSNFIQKGNVSVGTGKDPQTGETCSMCG